MQADYDIRYTSYTSYICVIQVKISTWKKRVKKQTTQKKSFHFTQMAHRSHFRGGVVTVSPDGIVLSTAKGSDHHVHHQHLPIHPERPNTQHWVRLVYILLGALLCKCLNFALGAPTVMPFTMWSLVLYFSLYNINQAPTAKEPPPMIALHSARFLVESLTWAAVSAWFWNEGFVSYEFIAVAVLTAAWIEMPTFVFGVIAGALVTWGAVCPEPTTSAQLALHTLCIGVTITGLLRYFGVLKSLRHNLFGFIVSSMKYVIMATARKTLGASLENATASAQVAARIVPCWTLFYSLDYILNIPPGGYLVLISLLIGLRALAKPNRGPEHTLVESTQSVFMACVLALNSMALLTLPAVFLTLIANLIMNWYLLAHLFPAPVIPPINNTESQPKATPLHMIAPAPEHLRAKLGKRKKDFPTNFSKPAETPAAAVPPPPPPNPHQVRAEGIISQNVSTNNQLTISGPRTIFLVFLTLVDMYLRLLTEVAPSPTLVNKVLSANTIGYSLMVFFSQVAKSAPPVKADPVPKDQMIPSASESSTAISKPLEASLETDQSLPPTEVTETREEDTLEDTCGTPNPEVTAEDEEGHEDEVDSSQHEEDSSSPAAPHTQAAASTPRSERRKWQAEALRDLVREEEERKATEATLRQRKEAARVYRQVQRDARHQEQLLKEREKQEAEAEKARLRQKDKEARHEREKRMKALKYQVISAIEKETSQTAERQSEVTPKPPVMADKNLSLPPTISQSHPTPQPMIPPSTESAASSLFSGFGGFGAALSRAVAEPTRMYQPEGAREYDPFGLGLSGAIPSTGGGLGAALWGFRGGGS